MVTWLITGCSAGLGRALATAVLSRGENVVVTARDAASVEDLARSHPGTALALPLDVTDRTRRDEVVRATRERFGAIDVLVNMVALATLLFLGGTLICALTDSWALFLTGRGIGALATGIIAVEYGLVRDLMPRRWIPICVAVLGTCFGLSAIVGPLIVGGLTDHYSWRSIFWFVLIYACVALTVFLLAVPESPLRVRSRLDIPGALLLGAGVALGVENTTTRHPDS